MPSDAACGAACGAGDGGTNSSATISSKVFPPSQVGTPSSPGEAGDGKTNIRNVEDIKARNGDLADLKVNGEDMGEGKANLGDDKSDFTSIRSDVKDSGSIKVEPVCEESLESACVEAEPVVVKEDGMQLDMTDQTTSLEQHQVTFLPIGIKIVSGNSKKF